MEDRYMTLVGYNESRRARLPASDDPVKEALKFVQDSEPDHQSIATLKAQRKALTDKRNACLPLEGNLIEHLEGDIKSLNERINTEQQILDAHLQELNYPVIDLSIPLRWRDYDGLPKLAVFSLNDNYMQFRFGRARETIELTGLATALIVGIGSTVWTVIHEGISNWSALATIVAGALILFMSKSITKIVQKRDCSMQPKLPNVFTKHYEDVQKTIRDIAKGSSISDGWAFNKVSRTTYFKGGIPNEVKAEITKARKQFGDDIYIVAEASGWIQRDKAIPPRNPDPLVIGVKGDNTWLITSFDLTPIEEAIKTEFTE